jgi:hypothetical protein
MTMEMSYLDRVAQGLIAGGDSHHFLLATIDDTCLLIKHILTAFTVGFVSEFTKSIVVFAFVHE